MTDFEKLADHLDRISQSMVNVYFLLKRSGDVDDTEQVVSIKSKFSEFHNNLVDKYDLDKGLE